MELLFWSSCLLIVYAYAGYPIALAMAGLFRRHTAFPKDYRPSVSIVVPVYNEETIIREKLENLLELEDPGGGVEILVVSDHSTDTTHGIVESFREAGVQLHVLGRRMGKGASLNLGVKNAKNEIIVFTDASIMLEKDALVKVLEPMGDPKVGCVSGEDRIEGDGGEGAYGKYELYLRNLESRVSSIVGASGCFYAQRRDLVRPFLEGMAPDFLSVLVTVENGFRAVTQSSARGWMKSVGAGSGELPRKVRTVLRGMTTLFHFRKLLNPFCYGLFSWELFSHKILRWLVGPCMVLALASNLAMASSSLYRGLLAGQLMFYLLALLGWKGPRFLAEKMPARFAFFFCMANYAVLIAWARWVRGVRQEIWEPSKR